MIYEFRAQDGETIERYYASCDDAPDIGEPITVDGKRYVRIISTPHLDAQLAYKCRGVHNQKIYGAKQWEGADEGFTYTDDGYFAPQSLSEKRAFMDRYGYTDPKPEAVDS